MRLRLSLSMAAALLAALPTIAAGAPAQDLMRGVPAGEATAAPLALSLAEAIARGLEQNLSVILEQQQLRRTESARLTALSGLLPSVSGSVRQSHQVLSTAAFGFTLPDLPTLIGPFDLFDARVTLSTPLFDARALSGLKSMRAETRAGQAALRDVRETVVLAVGSLYLQAQADAARVDSARAQIATAEALLRVVDDQRAAGLLAGIDVVRQQVQVHDAQARLIDAQNASEKRKLLLARAIGLPVGQVFTLTDLPRFAPAPVASLDAVVDEARTHRGDLAAARARVEAARAARQAAALGRLPTLHLDADLGAIGPRSSDIDRTYTVAAVARVPIFEGGRTRARVRQADADLHAREAELADIEAGVRYEAAAALLDVDAAESAVRVAAGALDLSRLELEQAQDRFRAGVSSTIELVQAQEAVARATEAHIARVYEHAVARGRLARVRGDVEHSFVAAAGGQQQ